MCVYLQEVADELNIDVKPSIYNDFVKLQTRFKYLEEIKDRDEPDLRSLSYQISNYKLKELLDRILEREIIISELDEIKYLANLTEEDLWNSYKDVVS